MFRSAVLVLVLASCASDQCADSVADGCHAADPIARGPFPVGVTTWELIDSSRVDSTGEPRRLRVEVWYPALASDGPSDEYDLAGEAPAELATRLAGVDARFPHDAVRDAPPNAHEAPYPLVLFSHGNGGIRIQNYDLMNHLASHGHVVAAPDHTGNTLWEGLLGELTFESSLAAFEDRLRDMPFVGDTVVNDEGMLHGITHPENWAVMGHSFGGSISLALTAESRAGPPDSRFRVAIPMTPGTGALPLLGYDTIRSRVPVLFFAAQRDETISWEHDQLPGYERMPEPKVLAAVREAGHFSYTVLCRPELEALATAAGEDIGDLLADGCGPEFIDPNEMSRVLRYLSTSFLHAYLRDSEPAFDHMRPESLPAEISGLMDYRVAGLP